MRCSLVFILFLISPTIFGGSNDQIRRKTSGTQNNGISILSGRIRSQINQWAANAIQNKKDESIKNPQECAQVLNEVLRNKPTQLLELMRVKRRILETILNKLDSNNDEREIYIEFYEIYNEMLKEVRSLIAENEITLNDLAEVETSKEGEKIVKFGPFQISEWPRKIFMFHGKENGDEKLRKIFEKFKRDGGRTKLATEWLSLDATMENIQETLLKADKFLRAFTGQPGSYMHDLKAIELGLKGTNDIRLGKMVYTEMWEKLNEDVHELRRVKKYLADERNVKVRYQVRKDGRVFQEYVRRKTVGAATSKSRKEDLSIEQVIINEEIHDATFFEDLFAPYLAEFFEILTKEEHNGGFAFNLIYTKNDHAKVLGVDVGQVILDEQVPKIIPIRREKSNNWKMEPKWMELVEIDQNPELNGKAKNPLQLEGHLLSNLLASLYAKLVGRFEHLTYRWKRPLINDPDLSLIFHAYNYALASELFKRMKELDEYYDVFYETQTSFQDSITMTPQREKHEEKNWLNVFLKTETTLKDDDYLALTPERETSEERERFERWEIIQILYGKIEAKKWEIMEKLVKNCSEFLVHMGYAKLLNKNEGGENSAAKALAETMQTEMAMTLDNLELNWAVDCHVDDIEKCLFAENKDLDFNMPEMRLFNEKMDQMSKVQKFLEWMYQKLNRQIAKMTRKFNREGNAVKSFLIAKCIEVLDEFRLLFENRITIADIFVPFWKEFKEFVAKPAFNFVAKSRLMRMFLGISDKIKFSIGQDFATIFWKYFEFDQKNFTENLALIDANLDKDTKEEDTKVDKKIAKSTISSIFKPIMRNLLKNVGIFQHFNKYFRINRLPELRLIFEKLKRKFGKKKLGAPPLSTAITSTTGVRKQWHTKWGHKVLSTLVINATYRSINIVVVQNGNAIRFATSSGFLLLTIVYMTTVIWVCRHLLWQITCSSVIFHCGHYIAVSFAIIASGIWLGLMLIIF